MADGNEYQFESITSLFLTLSLEARGELGNF